MRSGDRYQEVLAALELLFPPGRVIEIRAIGDDGISSGYFDDYPKAANELLIRDNDPRVSGIYVTLNEVNPALLARRTNRIKFRLGRKDATTADVDITRRHWLPIDIDPIRPSGIPSSEEEHAGALIRADSIATFLTDLGWPQPIIADSGNGAHLLYQIDLPNDDRSRTLIRSVLELLDIRFSDSRCKVDCGNFNASRIWKVYGTISRKGDPLPDRPHRRSRILSAPDHGELITGEQLTGLCSLYPSVEDPDLETGAGVREMKRGTTLDLASWLSDHHLSSHAKPYQGGTLFVLDSCPFSAAHTDGAFAIQFPNGAIFAGCHHDSCGSGRQRWPELRARYEPDVGMRLARLRSSRIREKNSADNGFLTDQNHPPIHESSPGECSTVSSDSPDDPIREQSLQILSTGDPLSFLLNTFGQSHEGDQTVAECLIHSLASRSVINSKGLHVSITGESGKGKSHAIDTMRTLIPEQFRLEGRMSDKALFYMEDLRAGTVITLDDVSLSDQMQEILKGVTTSFQRPFPYRTVNKDRKAQICTIPERCVWWIAKVEGAGDDQVFNRMLTCWIDDSEEQDLRVLDRTLAGAEQLPDAAGPESDAALICRGIWNELTPVWVVIPYATRIRFQSAENRRNPDMLLDLIRTNAALCQKQRSSTIVDGTYCVVATRDDFDQAARLFVALNGETGGQGNKLTRREAALIEKIASLGQSEVTISQLQGITGWANGSIHKLLHGYRSYGKSYSGLLEKCPAVSFLDRTVTKGDEGCTTLRRTKVYLWDPALYAAWVKGGSVWLVDEDEPGEDPVIPPGSAGDTPTGDPPGVEELTVREDPPPVLNQERSGAVNRGDATGIPLASVDPHEFILIDGFPDRRRCSVCGKKPTQYQERMTQNRMNGPPRPNLMLCVSCYQRAVSRAAASIITLPGVIDTSQMIRQGSSIGRCHVCDLRSAVWSDHGRIHLCDLCYHREVGTEKPDRSCADSGCGPP